MRRRLQFRRRRQIALVEIAHTERRDSRAPCAHSLEGRVQPHLGLRWCRLGERFLHTRQQLEYAANAHRDQQWTLEDRTLGVSVPRDMHCQRGAHALVQRDVLAERQ